MFVLVGGCVGERLVTLDVELFEVGVVERVETVAVAPCDVAVSAVTLDCRIRRRGHEVHVRSLRYSVARSRFSGLSFKCPNPVLQFTHNKPRTFLVACEWSTYNG